MQLSRRWKLVALLAVAVVVVSSAGYHALVISRPHQAVLLGFDPDAAYKDLQALCAIGPRVPGTEEDLQAAQHVEKRFAEAGLSNVHVEEHQVTTYRVNAASLALIALQLGRQVVKSYSHVKDFVLYAYSGATNGDLRLEIVDAGNGTEEAFQGVNCQGKAILVTQQCLPLAAEKGARAVIVQNTRLAEQLGFPPYQGGLYGGDANGDSIPYPDAHPDAVVPTCAVSRAVGDEIRGAMERARHLPLVGTGNVWVQLNFDTQNSKNSIYNVIGDVKGSKHPREFVYIVAHRDGTYISPSAVDNGAGTATILELARQLARQRPERTVRIISVDAEETGLLGATEYVKSHEAEVREGGRLVVNFDMNDANLERVQVMNLYISDLNLSGVMKDLRDRMFRAHPGWRAYQVNISEGGGGADGGPFMKRGTRGSYAMGEWGSSWEYHTEFDTLDHVSPDSWAVSGTILGSLALHVAGA